MKLFRLRAKSVLILLRDPLSNEAYSLGASDTMEVRIFREDDTIPVLIITQSANSNGSVIHLGGEERDFYFYGSAVTFPERSWAELTIGDADLNMETGLLKVSVIAVRSGMPHNLGMEYVQLEPSCGSESS